MVQQDSNALLQSLMEPDALASLEQFLQDKPEVAQDCSNLLMSKLQSELRELHLQPNLPLQPEEIRKVSVLLHVIQQLASYKAHRKGVLILVQHGLLDTIREILMVSLHAVRNANSKEINDFYEDVLETVNALADYSESAKGLVAEAFCDKLLQIVSMSSLRYAVRMETLKRLNLVLEKCPVRVREKLKKTAVHKELMLKLGQLISSVGDYEFQVAITEALFRLTYRTERESMADDWFDHDDILEAFLKVRDSHFETDCRSFLNVANRLNCGESNSVISLPCRHVFLGDYELLRPDDLNYQDFWVDFNTASRRISLFCQQQLPTDSAPSQGLTEDILWETVSIWAENISTYSLSADASGLTVNIDLKFNARDLIGFGPRFTSKTVTLKFSPGLEIQTALEKTFGKVLSAPQRKRKVSDAQHPMNVSQRDPKSHSRSSVLSSQTATTPSHRKISEPAETACRILNLSSQTIDSGSYRKVSQPAETRSRKTAATRVKAVTSSYQENNEIVPSSVPEEIVTVVPDSQFEASECYLHLPALKPSAAPINNDATSTRSLRAKNKFEVAGENDGTASAALVSKRDAAVKPSSSPLSSVSGVKAAVQTTLAHCDKIVTENLQSNKQAMIEKSAVRQMSPDSTSQQKCRTARQQKKTRVNRTAKQQKKVSTRGKRKPRAKQARKLQISMPKEKKQNSKRSTSSGPVEKEENFSSTPAMSQQASPKQGVVSSSKVHHSGERFPCVSAKKTFSIFKTKNSRVLESSSVTVEDSVARQDLALEKSVKESDVENDASKDVDSYRNDAGQEEGLEQSPPCSNFYEFQSDEEKLNTQVSVNSSMPMIDEKKTKAKKKCQGTKRTKGKKMPASKKDRQPQQPQPKKRKTKADHARKEEFPARKPPQKTAESEVDAAWMIATQFGFGEPAQTKAGTRDKEVLLPRQKLGKRSRQEKKLKTQQGNISAKDVAVKGPTCREKEIIPEDCSEVGERTKLPKHRRDPAPYDADISTSLPSNDLPPSIGMCQDDDDDDDDNDVLSELQPVSQADICRNSVFDSEMAIDLLTPVSFYTAPAKETKKTSKRKVPAKLKKKKKSVFSEPDETTDARSEVSWLASTARKKKPRLQKVYGHNTERIVRPRLIPKEEEVFSESDAEVQNEPVPKRTKHTKMPTKPKKTRKRKNEAEISTTVEGLYYRSTHDSLALTDRPATEARKKKETTTTPTPRQTTPSMALWSGKMVGNHLDSFDTGRKKTPVATTTPTPRQTTPSTSLWSCKMIGSRLDSFETGRKKTFACRTPSSRASNNEFYTSIERGRFINPDDSIISQLRSPLMPEIPDEQANVSDFDVDSCEKAALSADLPVPEPSNMSTQDDVGLSPSQDFCGSESFLLRSGPSQRQTMWTMTESSEADGEKLPETEPDIDLILAAPMKPRRLFAERDAGQEESQEEVYASSQEPTSTLEDRELESTDNLSCIDATYDSSLQTGVGALVKSFGSEIKRNLQMRRKWIGGYSKEYLQVTQGTLTSLWSKQRSDRQKALKRYRDAIAVELSELEKDVENAQNAQETMLRFFRKQQQVLHSSRLSQEQRLKNMTKLQSSFATDVKRLGDVQTNQEGQVKKLLQKEMRSLQRKLFQQVQQEEVIAMKRSLQAMLYQ